MLDHRSNDGRPGAGEATRRAAIRTAGVVLAVAGLALYVWLVGAVDVIGELGRVGPRYAALLVVVGFLPVLLWGLSLRLVLPGVGAPVRTREAFALFLASVFFNGITPLGQADGDPPSGLLIARAADAEFERGLAAIGSVNALNRAGVVFLGGVGAAWLAVRRVAPPGTTVAGAGALALTLGVVAVAAVAWRRRGTVVPVVGAAIAVLLVRLGEVVPVVPTTSRESIVERVRGFVEALERLGARPGRLAAAALLGVAGQVVVACVLWLALGALDAGGSVAVVLVVVPVAKLGGLSPAPGGTGSAEVLLSGLLVAIAGVTLPVATAAAILYRAAAFWLPAVAGGVVAVWLLAGGVESRDGRQPEPASRGTDDATAASGQAPRR